MDNGQRKIDPSLFIKFENSAGPLKEVQSRRDDEVLPALLEPFRIANKEDFRAQGPRNTCCADRV